MTTAAGRATSTLGACKLAGTLTQDLLDHPTRLWPFLRLSYHPDIPPILGLELILLDITRSESELDLIRQIKGHYLYQDTPLAVIAESAATELMQMAFAFGAHDFLSKPLSPSELTIRVRASLRLQHEIDRRKAREKELMEVTRQLSDLNSWLARLSLVDSLTNVNNRRGFEHAMDQEWRRSVRNQTPLTLIMVDIDDFKKYNDHFGHRAGDAALQRVASFLKEGLRRPGDIACRYGGEEFCIILTETDLEGGMHVAERIRSSLEAAGIDHPHSSASRVLTASFGIATLVPEINDSQSFLIVEADRLLYQAKNKGETPALDP